MKNALHLAIEARIQMADERYGPFASTHEAMGVALEEWHEVIAAVRSNDQQAIKHECLDLAAVCIRLAQTIDEADNKFSDRSTK
jgi:NTP pyrophosphatase (non-canonical NTP hydrolase)